MTSKDVAVCDSLKSDCPQISNDDVIDYFPKNNLIPYGSYSKGFTRVEDMDGYFK